METVPDMYTLTVKNVIGACHANIVCTDTRRHRNLNTSMDDKPADFEEFDGLPKIKIIFSHT